MAPTPLAGCFTAIITPMTEGAEIDKEGLHRLITFQGLAGVDGLVAVGTTGESPTLAPLERLAMVRRCREWSREAVTIVAGTGSNSTEDAMQATQQAGEAGASHALLVDPYYNAPSSLEIRREYYQPIANGSPDLGIIPYVIPSRTGTRLEPPDLALLRDACPNVVAVKEATGSDEYAHEVRRLLGDDFGILSGDDVRTTNLITDPKTRAQGVISVLSNVFPRTLAASVHSLRAGERLSDSLDRRVRALTPLLSLVTVETHLETAKGLVRVRARNPVPVKTIMNILGMPAGPCRPPLGRLTPAALSHVLDTLRRAYGDCPDLFDEIESAFDVSVATRLRDEQSWEGLAYVD
jgi:4-hydroxy-tetrahydrodipicolinate synthase